MSSAMSLKRRSGDSDPYPLPPSHHATRSTYFARRSASSARPAKPDPFPTTSCTTDISLSRGSSPRGAPPCASPEADDRSAASDRSPHYTVMIEDRDTVGGDPDIALQAIRPELQAEGEGLQGVFGGVCPGAAMSKCDRVVEQRRQPLLHQTMMPRGGDGATSATRVSRSSDRRGEALHRVASS